VKLATYRESGATKIGALDAAGARVFDLAAASVRAGAEASPFGSMLNLIDADDAGLDVARMLLAKQGGDSDLWSPSRALSCSRPYPSRARCATACRSPRISVSRRGARRQFRR
jgi:hypothetical protein